MLSAIAFAIAVVGNTPQANLSIRINQVGYLPAAPKTAVVCALEPEPVSSFTVVDMRGRRVFGPAPARQEAAFGPCRQTYRLDFSALRTTGEYILVVGSVASP